MVKINIEKPIVKKFKKFIISLFLISICFVLIWPALNNGYPLVYSDTGTYIAAGYTKEVPVDRPIIYCLFVRYMSLAHSLWFVLIAQVILVVYVIYMLVRRFAVKNFLIVSTIIVLVLSFTTSVSNYTSQIMPDIYSALSIIGIAIILTTQKMHKREYFLALIVVFSAMSHLSNTIVLLEIMILTFFAMLFRLVDKKIFYRICVISFIPIICTLCINKIYSGKFQISRASNVFFIGRMIEIGVVKEYLKENCDDNDYILCESIDRIPDLSHEFIWNANSPLYDEKCNDVSWAFCWEEKNDEFGKLMKDIIKISKYRNQILITCTKDFFQQCVNFKIGKLTPQRDGSPANDWIAHKFDNELIAYKNAKQYESELKFITLSIIQAFMVILSLIIITSFLILNKKINLNKEHILILMILIAGVLGNALTVVLFSTEIDRYQSRVIWIIPLAAFLLIYRYIISRETGSFDHPSPERDKLIKHQNTRPFTWSTRIGPK